MRNEVLEIINETIEMSLPDAAVRRALDDIEAPAGRTVIVAVGKAGWQMARAAADYLKGNYDEGYVITKYHHSKGDIEKFRIMEAGHPVLDENSVKATEVVMEAVKGLSPDDQVLFLLSGGGSALFEKPLISLDEMAAINKELLACGADIVEMNTIRKRLSSVKGGKFAKLCEPAHVYSIILSDIVGDHPEMIASGPAYPDHTATEDVMEIVERYQMHFSDEVMTLLKAEPVRQLTNITTLVTGGVGQLCQSAMKVCQQHGYEAEILTDRLTCEAREAGRFLGSIAAYHADAGGRKAFIAGGETVVHLKGNGLGGRNQEIALASAECISGLDNVVIASAGSDGTDGPTDAAGGIVDGNTRNVLYKKGLRIYDVLDNNDAYHALKAADGLIITGATGTNVNDVSIILISDRVC